MIAVVPKFQFFQLFVDHKDMAYHNVLDGIQLTGTPNLSSMMTPNSATCNVESSSSKVPPMQQEQQQQNVGHELRRSQRRQAAEGEGHIGLDSGMKTVIVTQTGLTLTMRLEQMMMIYSMSGWMKKPMDHL